MTTMHYGDYLAKVDFEEESKLFHGRVVNIRDVVNFYGGSAAELLAEFRRSIEEYLAVCEEEGIEPDKPYSGRFNVRLPPDLHRAIAETSAREGKSLNAWVADELSRAVGGPRSDTATKGSGKRARGAKSSGSASRRSRHARPHA